jgi:hypothetical protein
MDVDIKEQKIVTEDEINESGAIPYNVEEEHSGENLPNATDVLDQVIKILECMNTEEMTVLRKANIALFEQLMEEKFQEFSLRYYGIFKMILSGDDIEPLFKMLEMIHIVNSGELSFEDAEKNVGKYLSKFLPSKLLDEVESGRFNDFNDFNKKKHRKKR